MTMTVYINAFLQTLPIMGKGMAGIVRVAAVIVVVMDRAAKRPAKRDKDK